MTCDAFEASFHSRAIASHTIWHRAWFILSDCFPGLNMLSVDGQQIGASRITRHLERLREPHFSIRTHPLSIDFVRRTDGLCMFLVESQVSIDSQLWDRLAEAMSDRFAVFMRTYNKEYSIWQNAADPLQYNLANRSYAELPVYMDPVFGTEVIDTSSNPGRRVFRERYIEAIGATMWLGPLFEEQTGTSLKGLENETWHSVRRLECGLVRIQAFEKCFTESEGVQRELQERLRSRLFPDIHVGERHHND